MTIRKSAKSGFMVFLVIGTIVALAILFFSLSRHSISVRQTTVKVLEEEQAFEATQILANAFWTQLEEILRTKSGSPYLFPTQEIQSPINVFSPQKCDLRRGMLKLDFFNKEHFPSGLEIKNEILKLMPQIENPLVEADWKTKGTDEDPVNMETFFTGTVDLKISLRIKKSKTDYSFVFRRAFKIANVLPPVASKFTLYVRNVPTSDYFNVNSKGFQDDSGPSKILILHNSPKRTRYDVNVYRNSGWIYLGGNEIVLNLDGTHYARDESEFFLFYLNPVNNDVAPHFVSNYLGNNTKMRLWFCPLGCFHEIIDLYHINDGAGYGYCQPVRSLPYSGVLRLFGERTWPTPTRVIGKVFGRYVLNSALIRDKENDTIRDKVTSVRNPDKELKLMFPLPRITDPDYYRPTWVPPLFGDFINNPEYSISVDFPDLLDGFDMAWDSFFSGYENSDPNAAVWDYKSAMTKISFPDFDNNSAYNTLYDIFLDGMTDPGTGFRDRNIPPTTKSFSPKDYPRSDDDRDFTLQADEDRGRVLFQGNLKTLFQGGNSYYDPTRFAADFGYASQYNRFYKSQDLFKSEWKDSPTPTDPLYIEKPLFAYIDGLLSLPEGLIVNAPVLIVAKKGIEIGKVTKMASGILTMVAMEGDITILNPDELNAALVAPAGTLKWKSPLKIKGNVFVDSLDMGCIKASGGYINYDPEMDGSNSKILFKGLTVLLGPNFPLSLVKD